MKMITLVLSEEAKQGTAALMGMSLPKLHNYYSTDTLCTSGLSISYIAVITTYLLTAYIKDSLLRYVLYTSTLVRYEIGRYSVCVCFAAVVPAR